MDRVLHNLNYLRLGDLTDEWVEGIYYAEFLEFGEFPSEYESILENIEIRSVFRKIMNSVDKWLNSTSGTSEEKTWAVLSHEVNHKKLLALLAYYIDYGSKNIMVQEHRNTALLASRVYFKLLSIPGYKAYHIYHSQLFAQSLGCLSYPKTLCENEDNYFNLRQLTSEVNSVIKEVAFFAQDLRAVIDALQLNPEDMNFEDILSNLVEFTGGAIVNKLDIDKIELMNVSRVIYEMIDILLCDQNKDPNEDAIQLLFKCLLPKLVAASVDNRSANNLVRASYVTYTGLVLTKYGKSALSGFITLLQHLCYTLDGLERAEVRSARVSLIIGLMSLLPHKSYRYIVRWILKLSTTAKVAHRHIALELVSQLLNNGHEESSESAPLPELPPVPASVKFACSCADFNETAMKNVWAVGSCGYVAIRMQPVCTGPYVTDAAVTETGGESVSEISPAENQNASTNSQLDNQNISIKTTSANEDNSNNNQLENQRDPSHVQKENQGASENNQSENQSLSPNVQPSGSQDNNTTGTSNNQDSAEDNLKVIDSAAENLDLTVAGPSNSYAEARPEQSPVASLPESLEPITDSGIQDPTIGFDSECEDYIMSLLTNGPDGLAIGELPEPIPELGDIEDLGLFGDISDQPILNNEAEAIQIPEPATNDDAIVSHQVVEDKNKSKKKNESVVINEAQSSTNAEKDENAVVSNKIITDDESSQEPFENPDQVSEDDIAGLLRARPHTVPHAELLRAVYERVQDASSTLRARALAVLADCQASARAPLKRAVTELNGSGSVSRLMAVAARCVSDERAAVRRAAVSLVQRSLAAGPPPAPADLGILVSLCRDASILVRSAAIAALGDLVATRASDAVLDAFLTGPMHQMSDPETKIQEQVVALIQQVAIDKLQKYSAEACEHPLPWMFLAAITRHNMRRHLQKACTLLAKTSKCINHRVVDVVSTHLDTRGDTRDLQCLVLLTSAARLLDYSDVGFLLDYYYRLAASQDRDQRLMPLTLELLTLWSRYLSTPERTALRDHLVARLATSDGEDGCRIACASLAAHLDPSNLQWADELLVLAEQRALAGGGVREWVRAADLSLVAPTPPDPALLQLLLAALAQPPPEWTEAEAGAAAAGAGRLCVRSRGAAAAAAPALAALLHAPARALPARVNALLALADICTRYTCIVEPLMGSVAGCLAADGPAALRRAAARALTRLLLAGYLRLRAPLYYTYCALLADNDADVREPAEYYVTCCLTPDAIYHHFVDCVLHYNSSSSESISFDARQLIYDVMLQRMSLVQKLNLQCRLAREVLQHAADMTEEDDGVLAPELSAALLDTITLLCGPRMKLPKKPQNQGDVADIDDLQERVTTNIVSHKMKRTVAEVLVPAVLRLYARVRGGGGQVAAYLVRIATDLLADYRQEIEELIENDEDMVERIQMFQETIGVQSPFGNARNLVTASAPPEPDTPRAPRRRAPRAGGPPRKRALRI